MPRTRARAERLGMLVQLIVVSHLRLQRCARLGVELSKLRSAIRHTAAAPRRHVRRRPAGGCGQHSHILVQRLYCHHEVE